MAHLYQDQPLARYPLRVLSLLLLLLASACDVSNDSEIVVRDGDPAVVDFPIAYVYRPIPTDAEGNVELSLLDPAAFHPGAQLVIRDRASASARERVITDRLFEPGPDGLGPEYDVKDLSVSADGKRLLFSVRAPQIEGADESEQPKWNIWQYDIAEDDLQPAINTGAERGDDVAARFLPGGGIVFSSNRQTRSRAILTDELKPQYSALTDKREQEAFNLHVISGADQLEQITYNVSHDLRPTVLDDGRLLFLRHDGVNQHNQLSWYTVNSDGSDVQPYYGYHSQTAGTADTSVVLTRPQPLADGRLLAILQPRETDRLGGDIIAVDGANFIDVNQPTSANAGSSARGHVSLSAGAVNTTNTAASTGGTYHSAYPFYDGSARLLTSWSPCRLLEPQTGQIQPCPAPVDPAEGDPAPPAETAIAAPPLYGLWAYNPLDGTQQPIAVPEEGYMYSDAVVMAAVTGQTAAQSDTRDADLKKQGLGTLHIRSVYDIDGIDSTAAGLNAMADPAQTPADQRPIRFLRLVKNVPIPPRDVLEFERSIFGRTTAHGMRDILGYVPVEPDGSVLFEVPADIAFTFDLLDAEGQRVGPRHENWLHLRPGEQRQCTGCHTRNSSLPHGRRDAEYAGINPGATGGTPFANTRLTDAFGTPHPYPEFGETMAECYARVNGPRTPSADLLFSDEWTNPATAEPGADIQLRYVEIAQINNSQARNCAELAIPPAPWLAPTSCISAGSWNAQCRITINYLDSIEPLWQSDRRNCDEFGEVVADNTCTKCHTRTLDGMLQEPAGQLELTGEPSADRSTFVTSYAELLFDDNAQELNDGALVDIMIARSTGEFETDDEGEPLRDDNGQLIPIIEYRPVTVPAAMSANGARASNAFFSRFREGGSHQDMLSRAELKLIAEWLDIGAQYYNNPFNAPAD